MIKKIIFILILFVSFLNIYCCDSKKNKTELSEDSTELAEKKLDSLQKERIKNQITNFANKYDAQTKLNKLDIKYSIDLESIKIGKNNNILIDRVRIEDIFKQNNSFYLYISFGYSPEYYFVLECNEEQEKKLNEISKKKHSKGKNNELAFIITLDKIQKIKLNIDSEIEKPNSKDEYSDIILNVPDAFKGKGTLIDFLEYEETIYHLYTN